VPTYILGSWKVVLGFRLTFSLGFCYLLPSLIRKNCNMIFTRGFFVWLFFFFSQYFETKTKKIIEKVRTKLVGEKLFNFLWVLKGNRRLVALRNCNCKSLFIIVWLWLFNITYECCFFVLRIENIILIENEGFIIHRSHYFRFLKSNWRIAFIMKRF